MMAGCLGGPLAGLIAGVCAGLHRLLMYYPNITGGTSIPCAVSTLLIGLICGCLSHSFQKRKHRWAWAFLIALGMETLHLLLAFSYLVYRNGTEKAWAAISEIILPFLMNNSVGFSLMMYVMDKLKAYKNTEDHSRQVESELNIAEHIQDSMLPKIFPDFPGRKEFALSASMNPAKEVGGDFYDFFFADDDHFAFLVADVSGKGVPAALFMVIAKTLIKNNVQSGLPLEEAMTKTNLELLEGNEEHMFVTCWIGVIQISTGEVTYVNCGHNPPLVSHAGQPFTYLKDISGFVLAGSKKTKYRAFKEKLDEGDRIFLYTDGITEAMNSQKEQFGEKRLLECISSGEGNLGTDGIIQKVKDQVKAFTLEAEQSDDMTMVAMKINGFYESIKVAATEDNFSVLSDFMEKKLTAKEVSPALLSKMNVVLDELYSNIVKYSGAKDAVFSVFAHNHLLSLRFRYGGELFDITKVPEPDTSLPASQRKIGGLGLLIVKKICDRVTYEEEDGDNLIVVDKSY